MSKLFSNLDYAFGIRLSQRVDGKVLITFNARNEHDRCKFAEDLKESVLEMDEMENLRIEAELERQKSNRGNRTGKIIDIPSDIHVLLVLRQKNKNKTAMHHKCVQINN